MKIKSLKRSTNHKKLLIIVCVILLLIAIPLTYVYAFNGNLFGWKKPTIQNTNKVKNSINYGPATSEQQKAGTTIKSGSADTPPKPTPIPGSTQKNVQVIITSANQDKSGSPLLVSTQIGAVVDSGTCTLSLTKAGETTVTKTAGVQALASTSTCQGFNVPASASDLSVGTWHILIEYSNSALTGSATKDVVIK